MLELNEKNFEKEVLKSETPALVDFWAGWCMPCKMITPTVEEIAKDYDGKLKVAKINVDDNPALATKYEIMSIPTLVIFKAGKPVDRITGVVGKRAIEKKLKKVI